MAEHVTRCPHCHTSFRIRSEHLAAAKGKVRCGSCLQVFNARENLVNTSTAPKDTVLKEASNTPAVHHQTHLQATPSERLASVEEDPQEHVAPPQVDTASGDDDLSNHEEVPADELFDSFFDDPEPTTTETSRASHPKSLDIGASEPREESLEELFGLAPKQEPASKKESLLSDDPFADFNEIIARGSSGSDSGDIEIDESLLDFGQQTKSTATEKTEDSDDEDWARALLEDDDEVELDLSEDPVPEEFTGTNTRQDRSQGKKQAEQDLYAIQNLKPGSETTAISK
ncbi:MAG: MJ0042-type zinc finger domain-containing protein, partial [Oceanobacter sp.]